MTQHIHIPLTLFKSSSKWTRVIIIKIVSDTLCSYLFIMNAELLIENYLFNI